MPDSENLISVAALPAPRDPHRFSNELDSETIKRLVDRLESRAKDPVFMRPFERYADHLDLQQASRVLEIGSGTGAICRALAARPEFRGAITGVDQSPDLVGYANRFVREAGLSGIIDFRVGDAHSLELADDTYDVVLVHTVLSHVSEPDRVVSEVARVLAPGGLVALFDGDYASLTFAHEDELLGRKMDHALAAATFNNRLVMRELPDLLERSGLRIEHQLADVVAEIGAASFFRSFAETYAPNVKAAGLVAACDVDDWVDAQRQAMRKGRFFGSCNYYTYVARKPAVVSARAERARAARPG